MSSESSFFSGPVPTASIPNTTAIVGPGGSAAPQGGSAGQFIKKLSSTIYDTLWSFISIPDVVRSQTVAPVSGVVTIDYTQGEYVYVNVTANVTSLVILNWPVSGKHGKLTLEIKNTGAFTWGNWAGAKWAAGSAPAITSGANKVDIIVLHTANGGSSVYGSVAGQNYF
jgi:hypothetical protein